MGGEATGASVVLTTKGDIVGYDTARKRIGVGVNDQILTADSTNANGLAWKTASGGAETHNFTSAETLTPTTQTGVTKITVDSDGISGGDLKVIIDGVTKETITTALFSNRIYNPSTSISLVSANGTGEWDISNSAYTSKSLDISPQGTNLIAMAFSSDGTKCYVVVENDKVYQYNLTTAWDISTASYASKSYTHSLANPKGIFFKSDGTEMYLAQFNGSITRRYPLSTAWDISTVGSQDQSLSTVLNQDLFISSDGTQLFVSDNAGDVYSYEMSTGWDLTTASSITNVNPSDINVITGLHFSSDGTIMYATSWTANGEVKEYALSTAWDLSTLSFTRSYSTSSVTGDNQQGIFWSTDGTQYYILSASNNIVYQYEVSSGTFSGSILSTVG
jgi:hypothetical protein